MFNKFEKSWPFVSIALILAILASLFFWPGVTRLLSGIVIGLGLVAVLAFTVRRPVEAHRQGRMSLPEMWRNIIIDVLGVLVAMTAVILAAGWVARAVARAAGKAWGNAAGILAAVLVGLVIGFTVGFLVRWLWGLLTRPRRAS
jgi:ribose/xylose/arabinose/galactoside ABC-type transport system permease subunit